MKVSLLGPAALEGRRRPKDFCCVHYICCQNMVSWWQWPKKNLRYRAHFEVFSHFQRVCAGIRKIFSENWKWYPRYSSSILKKHPIEKFVMAFISRKQRETLFQGHFVVILAQMDPNSSFFKNQTLSLFLLHSPRLEILLWKVRKFCLTDRRYRQTYWIQRTQIVAKKNISGGKCYGPMPFLPVPSFVS